ncbi:hypothetical protein EYF80_018392 [Liparis tanakae]|uniref:Uncharacterized protein n=1 Tax=Liparis tanakae TaxID=230148 RepID=A0A4Z2I1Z6_9TELE|nr:hypothetical protein EYF80_018392 [Liparis tanakae]
MEDVKKRPKHQMNMEILKKDKPLVSVKDWAQGQRDEGKTSGHQIHSIGLFSEEEQEGRRADSEDTDKTLEDQSRQQNKAIHLVFRFLARSPLSVRWFGFTRSVRVLFRRGVKTHRSRLSRFGPACVHEADDELRILIDEHAGQRQHGAGAAEGRQLAAEEQLRQQQISHHAQIAEDVQRDGGGEGDDEAAGQVVHHRAQAAEQDEEPQVAVVMKRRLQQRPVLQGQSGHGQDAEARNGHHVEQEHRVDLLLLE